MTREEIDRLSTEIGAKILGVAEGRNPDFASLAYATVEALDVLAGKSLAEGNPHASAELCVTLATWLNSNLGRLSKAQRRLVVGVARES